MSIPQAHAILTGAARASDYRDVAEAYIAAAESLYVMREAIASVIGVTRSASLTDAETARELQAHNDLRESDMADLRTVHARLLRDHEAALGTLTAAQKLATEERDRRMRDEVRRVAAERVAECALRLASDLAAGGGPNHAPNVANAATESPQDAPIGSGPLPPMPREAPGGQKGAGRGSPNWPDRVAVELGRGGR
jgi:hypothetical protein